MKNNLNIFSVEGKRVLITGAANGNGKAIAKGFGNAGSELFLLDIDDKNLEIVANDIEKETGSKVHRVTVDLRSPEEIDMFLDKNNNFDVVINNAGVTHNNHFIDYKDSDWDETYKVNFFAPYKIMQKVSKNMSQKKSGSIINVTSLGAELGFPNNPAYVAFKGALKQLTKAAAYDLSPNGIRVNSVGPGYHKTNMTAASWNDKSLRLERSNKTLLGRWGEPDDLIGIMIFLASDASSYITGQEFYVDGGWLAKGL
ncbi:SDR family oxidoreductase [SAR86 cluster bacterium]|nr:SDR family oxidoreductase [SAR86 cluster bacterium]